MRSLRCPECQSELPLDPLQPPPVTLCPICSKPIRLTPLPPEEPPRVPLNLPHFKPDRYHPDGGFSASGLVALAGALALAAVGLGWLASFIGQWFYFVLIFPAAIGGGLYSTGWVVAKKLPMRNPVLGGVLGMLSGILAILAMHYSNYVRDIEKAVEVLQPADPAQVKKLLKEKIHFGQYMDDRAKAGVRIGDPGLNLGHLGSWLYWIAELALVVWLACAGVASAAQRPFCPACNSWKEVRLLGALPDLPSVFEALETGDLTQLAARIAEEGAKPLVLNAAICPRCTTAADLPITLARVTRDNQNQIKLEELLHLTYPGEALAAFQAIFQGETPINPNASGTPS
jgi:hypothetical protein